MRDFFTKNTLIKLLLVVGIFFFQILPTASVNAASNQPTTLTSQSQNTNSSSTSIINIDCSSPSNSSNFNCYQLLTPLPNPQNPRGQGLNSINTSNPLPYIITMAEILVSLGVVLAVFFIVYGGIIKMTAVDSVSNQQKGTAIIIRSIFGLLLLGFSYILIVTINPSLLNNTFTSINQNLPPPILSATSTPTPTTPTNTSVDWYFIPNGISSDGSTPSGPFTQTNCIRDAAGYNMPASACYEVNSSIGEWYISIYQGLLLGNKEVGPYTKSVCFSVANTINISPSACTQQKNVQQNPSGWCFTKTDFQGTYCFGPYSSQNQCVQQAETAYGVSSPTCAQQCTSSCTK